MSSQFSVCSYNLGGSVNDYYDLCRYLKLPLEFKNQEEQNEFYAKYSAVQQKTTDLLTAQPSDIYCLQEVANCERPLIKTLKDKGFQIVHAQGTLSGECPDAVIALNPNRFTNITNHSIDIKIDAFFSKDVAIATAFDTELNQQIVVVSAHAPGFNLINIKEEEAAEGDFYCEKIAEKLSVIASGCAIHVIGADMNANPEKWEQRLQIFSNKGFEVLRTCSSTSVNPRDTTYQEREIDFIFVKTISSIWQKIAAIFVRTILYIGTINPIRPIEWDANTSASDHLPIFANISRVAVDSLIYRLWLSVYHCFVPAEPKQLLSP